MVEVACLLEQAVDIREQARPHFPVAAEFRPGRHGVPASGFDQLLVVVDRRDVLVAGFQLAQCVAGQLGTQPAVDPLL